MSRIAVVPGSFDPVTKGHLDVISRAARLFDQLHVVVVHNPEKSAMLPIAKRVSLIQESLEYLMNGRTVIVIAHRLSTIQNADRILVLEAGRLVEQGTFEELIEQQGRFWRYHSLQPEDSTGYEAVPAA